MRNLILIVLILISITSFSKTYITTGLGSNWDDTNSWNLDISNLEKGDTIIVKHDLIFNSLTFYDNIIFFDNSTLNGDELKFKNSKIKTFNILNLDLNKLSFFNSEIDLEKINLNSNNVLIGKDTKVNIKSGIINTNNLITTGSENIIFNSEINISNHFKINGCNSNNCIYNIYLNNKVKTKYLTFYNNARLFVNSKLDVSKIDFKNFGSLTGEGILKWDEMLHSPNSKIGCHNWVKTYSLSTTPTKPESHNFNLKICDAVLPIKLYYFEGKTISDNEVKFKWVSLSEVNNDYYTIQRSYDNKSWEDVSYVEGVGNSKNKEYYSTILNQTEETAYYRLKQTDFNGNYEIFKTIVIKTNISYNSDFYPNPIKRSENLKLKHNDYISFKIYTVNGVLRKNIKSKNNIDISDLKSGVYIVVIKNKNEIKKEKLFVE